MSLTEFERGLACAAKFQPGLHAVLPAGARQLLREAAAVGSYGSSERAAAINKASAEIRKRWPECFRVDI
jgi:hypothetical protein